ncbi:MAG TPA: TIGR03086 family protein, partial [Actinomycetota bacterium]|nr:TIGR03086 family protein [Actinomycetota bacterium]
DLARGIGANERMDPELLQITYDTMAPFIAEFKASGIYGPDVQPPPGADLQTRLLAMVGRVA